MGQCYHESMKNNEKLQFPQIALGADSLNRLPDLLREYGTKVLLVHGHRPVEDGLLAKVRILLEKEHIPCADLGQILPNPTYTSVKRGIHTARKKKCDVILSLGGGSTLQCAKAIALGVPYKGEAWDFWKGSTEPQKILPLGAILTIPESRAELSESCTIVKKGKQKTFRSPLLVCDFAVLDPNLSQYPLYPTMNQVFDIFEHLFFAWLEKTGEQRMEAAELMKRLFACSTKLREDISDIPARTELFQVGLEMGEKIGHITVGIGKLADALAFTCSLPGGSAGSALFCAWCEELSEEQKKEAAILGTEVFGLPEADYDRTMEAFCAEFGRMNMPMSIPDAGLVISDKKLMKIASSDQEKKILRKANRTRTGAVCRAEKPAVPRPEEGQNLKPEESHPLEAKEPEPAAKAEPVIPQEPGKPEPESGSQQKKQAAKNAPGAGHKHGHRRKHSKKKKSSAPAPEGAGAKTSAPKIPKKKHAHKDHAHLKKKAALRSKSIAAKQQINSRSLSEKTSRPEQNV